MYQILTSTQMTNVHLFQHNTDNTFSKPVWVKLNNAQCWGTNGSVRLEYMELNRVMNHIK